MIKEILKITKNNLDFSLNEYEISIQISLDGFSFCMKNFETKEVVYFHDFEIENEQKSPEILLQEIENYVTSQPLLNSSFKKVSVIHTNNLVSQVPKVLFNKYNLANYLNYSIKLLANDFITYDEVANQLINVYIPFVNVNNYFFEKFGSFTYKHSSTIVLEQLLSIYKNKEGNYCFVNVYKNSFEIVILKDGIFELFNTFTFTTKEDFIYYILFVAEQLQLNPEEFNLVLLGEIEKDSELYKITFDYVRNISFFTPTISIQNQQTNPHNYFTILHA